MGARLDPAERDRRADERRRRSFSDEGYRHYDADAEGFGSPDEWMRTAEQRATGRTFFRGARVDGRRTYVSADMRLLGLDEMPGDVAGLKSAFRAKVMVAHPDHGGTASAFKAIYAAYERLLVDY